MSNRPLARFVYKERDTSVYQECGLLWPSKKEGYNPNMAPHTQESEGKITMADALERVARKEGFINIMTDKGKLLVLSGAGDDFDTDDF